MENFIKEREEKEMNEEKYVAELRDEDNNVVITLLLNEKGLKLIGLLDDYNLLKADLVCLTYDESETYDFT
jgi:hypothetical protein